VLSARPIQSDEGGVAADPAGAAHGPEGVHLPEGEVLAEESYPGVEGIDPGIPRRQRKGPLTSSDTGIPSQKACNP